MLRRFFRDSAIYAASTLVSRGINLLLIPVYTRFLTAKDLGIVELVTVAGSVISIVLALEISQAVARYQSLASDPSERVAYVSTAFWFTAAVFGLFSVVALGLAQSLSPSLFGLGFTPTLLSLMVVFIAVNGVTYFLQNLLRWELKPWSHAAVSILGAVVTAALVIVLIGHAGIGLIGLYSASILGALTGACLALARLRGSISASFDAPKLRRMVKFSAPLAASGIAAIVFSSTDRVVIQHFSGLGELGIYGIALRFAAIMGLVLVGFQTTIVPLVTTRYRDPDTPRQLARVFRLFLALSLPAALCLSLFAPEILMLFTTPVFFAGAQIIPILTAGTVIAGMYVFAPGLWIAGRSSLTLAIYLVLATVNVGVNLFLVPKWGVTGAAYTSFLTAVLSFVLLFAASQRFYHVPFEWARILGAIVFFLLLIYACTIANSHPVGDVTLSLVFTKVFLVAAASAGLVAPLVKRAELQAILSRLAWIYAR